MTEEQRKSFEDACRPLIKWLAEYGNPHATSLVDCMGAELVIGEASIIVTDYIKD